MRLALLAACTFACESTPSPKSPPTPPPTPAADAWSVSSSSQMLGAAPGAIDLIELDSTGTMHDHAGALDLGSWQVPADTVAEIKKLVDDPEAVALRDVPAMGEGYTYKLVVHRSTGDRKVSISGEMPAALKAINEALGKQIEAHAKAEQTALGPFSIEVTGSFEYFDAKKIETVSIDSTGLARHVRDGAEVAHRTVSPHRLAYLAMLLRLPSMIGATAPPAADHPMTFVIKRGDQTQTLATDYRAMPLPIANLYSEVSSERAAFTH